MPFESVVVASPDGRVTFTLSGDPERLTYQVSTDGRSVLEPSGLRLSVGGFDLGSGVVLERVERAEVNETYAWHGAHRQAVNRGNVATIGFTHDLSMTAFRLQ